LKRLQRLYPWWYAALALGFVLLGLNEWLMLNSRAGAALRWLVAAGFAALAWMEWGRQRRRK
jgi:CDP-diglyceride synthetase